MLLYNLYVYTSKSPPPLDLQRNPMLSVYFHFHNISLKNYIYIFKVLVILCNEFTNILFNNIVFLNNYIYTLII